MTVTIHHSHNADSSLFNSFDALVAHSFLTFIQFLMGIPIRNCSSRSARQLTAGRGTSQLVAFATHSSHDYINSRGANRLLYSSKHSFRNSHFPQPIPNFLSRNHHHHQNCSPPPNQDPLHQIGILPSCTTYFCFCGEGRFGLGLLLFPTPIKCDSIVEDADVCSFRKAVIRSFFSCVILLCDCGGRG